MAEPDFEWITAPQPTILKGQPIYPVPTIAFKPQAFKGFPLTSITAAAQAFYVSCFVLDKDGYDPKTYVDEGHYTYMNEYVDGRKATVRVDEATQRYYASFENLRINISGFHVLDGIDFPRKISRKEFKSRRLVFQGWVQLLGGSKQCIFQEAYPINVYTHLLQIPAHEITIKYSSPASAKAHNEKEVYVTGTGFVSPTFIFFANDPAQVLSQDFTWIRCNAPPLGGGKARLVVYSGGNPSNVDQTFLYQDPLNPGDDSQMHEIISADSDGIFGDEGLGLYNPDSNEWEFPTFVEKFLSDFCNPETINETHFGANALHIAASYGKVSFLEYYMQDKPDPNMRDKTGSTPLYLAASCDRLNAFQFLLSVGADVKKADNDGVTCLHQSARNGNLEMMQLCLSKGASPNVISTYGDSALHYAVSSGQMEPVQLLLNAGANPNTQNKAGESPLHWACLFDFASIGLELWHYGAKEDLADIDGDTPMKIRAIQLKPPRRMPLGQVSSSVGVPAELPPNTGTFQCRLCKNTFKLSQGLDLKGNRFDKDCYDKLMSAQKDRAPPTPAPKNVGAGTGKYVPVIPKDVGAGTGKYAPVIPGKPTPGAIAAKGSPPPPPIKKK